MNNKNEKRPLKHFVVLFRRYFWRLCSVNFLYFIVTLPLLAALCLRLGGLFRWGFDDGRPLYLPTGIALLIAPLLWQPPLLFYTLLAVSALLWGGAQTALYAYIEGIAREQPLTVSEAARAAGRRFRVALSLGIFELFICVLLLLNLSFFVGIPRGEINRSIFIMSQAATAAVFLLYVMLRRRWYILTVCSELNLLGTIKTSFFELSNGLLRQIAALIFSAIVWGFCIFTLPIVSLILIPLAAHTFCALLYVVMSSKQ